MNNLLRSLRLSVLAGALAIGALSCATAPKRAESPPRMKDSAPEKVAAQRAGGTHELQQLEQDDARWGIDAARERKQQQDDAKARQKASDGKKGVEVTPPAR